MENKNILYVACRGGSATSEWWQPVGMLEFVSDSQQTLNNGFYRFRYTQGTKRLPGFVPFAGMSDLESIYESDELFPLFSNRLLPKSRPEYKDYLKWSGFDPEQHPTPMEILAVTEGRRVTDSIEVFPCPQKGEDGFVNKFFIHGIRRLTPEQVCRVNKLTGEEVLRFQFEDSNAYDEHAVAIHTSDDVRIGYLPRYLTRDVRLLQSKCLYMSIDVVRINPDAPLQQRVLCEMNSCWPEGFTPCSDDDFVPIVAAE